MAQKIIELPYIPRPVEIFEKIERAIRKAFFEEIYAPLMAELNLKIKIKNAKWDDLAQALKSGKVTFYRGRFRGKFNSRISKELKSLGAIWDKKNSSFKILSKDLPYSIREVILYSENSFIEKIDRINKKLAQILPQQVSDKAKVAEYFDEAIKKTEDQFQKNISKLTVQTKLSDTQRAKIADEWQNNMDIWIQKFTEDHIKELRQTVMQSALAGNRFESLTKGIQSSYGVSERKAKFLARQETNLLLAKLKETRYISAGIYEYKWGCVKMPHDKTPKKHTMGNVRYFHGKLEGKIFRWDKPPITSENPERRNNPGEDYNCRCFSIPIVKF